MEQKKLKIIVKDHSKIDGHITYTLMFELPEGIAFKVLKRYSELKTLHDLLKKETNSNSFPKFPPKKFFGFANEEFINKRQQELNVFFEGICNSKEFSELKNFKAFVENCKKSVKDFIKLDKEKKEEKKEWVILKKRSSDKTMSTPFLEKLKPQKSLTKRLSQDEIKQMENEFKNIINDITKKYISLDFEVELKPNQKNEREYNKIINEKKNLENEEIKENIEPGNDDNFNAVSGPDENFDNIEKEINEKMNEIINKKKEIEKIYDFNEIIKIL